MGRLLAGEDHLGPRLADAEGNAGRVGHVIVRGLACDSPKRVSPVLSRSFARGGMLTVMRRWVFPLLILIIAAGALLARLPGLPARPMHTDEAIHAEKFNELWTTGVFVYDPQ